MQRLWECSAAAPSRASVPIAARCPRRLRIGSAILCRHFKRRHYRFDRIKHKNQRCRHHGKHSTTRHSRTFAKTDTPPRPALRFSRPSDKCSGSTSPLTTLNLPSGAACSSTPGFTSSISTCQGEPKSSHWQPQHPAPAAPSPAVASSLSSTRPRSTLKLPLLSTPLQEVLRRLERVFCRQCSPMWIPPSTSKSSSRTAKASPSRLKRAAAQGAESSILKHARRRLWPLHLPSSQRKKLRGRSRLQQRPTCAFACTASIAKRQLLVPSFLPRVLRHGIGLWRSPSFEERSQLRPLQI